MGITHGKNKKEVKQKTVSPNEKVISEISFNSTTMEDSVEQEYPKNPLLFSTVIRCVLKFLNIEDIKICRLISQEWGSTGLIVLAKRTIISFKKYQGQITRLPVDFHSCFLDSATLFSAFKISGYCTRKSGPDFWTIKELTKWFDVQQKYIKELTLDVTLRFRNLEENRKQMDISSWISKSPMIQKNAIYMTKLSIKQDWPIIHLHLISHIKELTLSDCRINIEEGIQICPIKLKLDLVTIYQDGIKLDRVRINDFVDFRIAKDVYLHSKVFAYTKDCTKFVVDLRGKNSLEILILEGVEILNGEVSEWVIEHLETTYVPYSLNSKMEIKELYLTAAGYVDLFELPNTIEDLVLNVLCSSFIRCSQQVLLEDLQYLYIIEMGHSYPETDYSFLSYFMHCPQLTHLKLRTMMRMKMKSYWMPKTVKTLILENSSINLLDDSNLNLEKLIVSDFCARTKALCNTKIVVVDDLIIYRGNITVDKDLPRLLRHRKRFCFSKRLYIGKLQWGDKKLENSALKHIVDVQSSFYVFENDREGRAFSEKTFYELIPKNYWCRIEPYRLRNSNRK